MRSNRRLVGLPFLFFFISKRKNIIKNGKQERGEGIREKSPEEEDALPDYTKEKDKKNKRKSRIGFSPRGTKNRKLSQIIEMSQETSSKSFRFLSFQINQ